MPRTTQVQMMVPEVCRGRLTLSQGGNAIVLANGQWLIVFGENAEDATFSVVVSEDDNELSESCTLPAVVPTATPPPYTVTPNTNKVRSTLRDDDDICIAFETARSSVKAGETVTIVAILSVVTARTSESRISFVVDSHGTGSGGLVLENSSSFAVGNFSRLPFPDVPALPANTKELKVN